jgi:hypothetical protein
MVEDATALALELRALLHDQFELFALETRLAGKSLVTMIAAAIWIGTLLATAWLGLIGALMLILIRAGLPAIPAALSISALSLALTVLLYWIIRKRSRTLGYPATLRTLSQRSLQSREGKRG